MTNTNLCHQLLKIQTRKGLKFLALRETQHVKPLQSRTTICVADRSLRVSSKLWGDSESLSSYRVTLQKNARSVPFGQRCTKDLVKI